MLTVRPDGGGAKLRLARDAELPEATRARFAELGVLMAILAVGAALFIGLSLLMDPGFFQHYAAFGESVGVADPLLRRWYRFRQFFAKLYTRAAGTYYLPPVRLQLLVGALSMGAGTVIALVSVARRKWRTRSARALAEDAAWVAGPSRAALERAIGRLILMVIATLVAFFAVGKFSPPSIVFLFPPGMLLLGAEIAWGAHHLTHVRSRADRGRPLMRVASAAGVVALSAVVLALMAASGASTVRELAYWRRFSYADYVATVRRHVMEDEVALANLNAGFALAPGQLRVWRDLASLEGTGLTFTKFVERERISTILYPDELDVIFRERPVWNELYGNLYPYYEEMQLFLAEACELVAVYDAPVYAMRIVPKMGQNERIRVYRVRVPGS